METTKNNLNFHKPLILIGMPGCGKSAIGKRLAKLYNKKFIDLDNFIEKNTSKTVSEIFNLHGEDYFRKLEVKYLHDVILTGSYDIIAPGGGAFLNEEIRAVIKKHCISIWIKADLEILLERVSRKKNRPLLEKGDKKTILSELINKRYPIYEKADIIINSTNGPHQKVIDTIIKQLS